MIATLKPTSAACPRCGGVLVQFDVDLAACSGSDPSRRGNGCGSICVRDLGTRRWRQLNPKSGSRRLGSAIRGSRR